MTPLLPFDGRVAEGDFAAEDDEMLSLRRFRVGSDGEQALSLNPVFLQHCQRQSHYVHAQSTAGILRQRP